MRSMLLLLVVVGLLAGGAAYYAQQWTGEAPLEYRTATIEQSDLTAVISATGTLEPEEVVDVGAQVAGLITAFGRDPHDPDKQVDYGTNVEAGTILARIDPRMYKAEVDQAQALYNRSVADLAQLQAKAVQAEKELKRAEALRPQNAIADTDFDLAVANYEVAKANLEVGKATIEQNKATLQTAKINLDYTTITSPVKGVIIDRRVNIGQTVVASLSAPSLFLIAKDLSRMQVWASVNEADIGHIRLGMPVEFTVDAFADETFAGKVSQIRLNAQMTQNVVTYTVVVTTDNSNGQLLPYLTANLRFLVEQRHDVLTVPNAALRWQPRPEQIAPAYREADEEPAETAAEDAGLPPVAPQKKPNGDSAAPERRGQVYVEEGEFVRPLDVQVGMSDGAASEISGAGVEAGLVVVIGETPRTDDNDNDTTNPFLPKIRRSAKPKSGQ